MISRLLDFGIAICVGLQGTTSRVMLYLWDIKMARYYKSKSLMEKTKNWTLSLDINSPLNEKEKD